VVRQITPQIAESNLEESWVRDGLATLELPNGQKCNRDGDGFIVVDTGERLRRV
jgi:hypothetical protein